MKDSPVKLHISVPGSVIFSFGHHGKIDELTIATKESSEAIKILIDLLPKKAKNLEEISKGSPESDRMFF
jgi:hypothetical protein